MAYFPVRRIVGGGPKNLTRSRDSRTRNHSDERMKECTLKPEYIEYIQNGQKTVEGRINSGMFKNFKGGEHVRFFNAADPLNDVVCEITGVATYADFESMLTAEGLKNCLPRALDIPAGVKVYHQIPGYEERAKQHGVVALRLKVIKIGAGFKIE